MLSSIRKIQQTEKRAQDSLHISERCAQLEAGHQTLVHALPYYTEDINCPFKDKQNAQAVQNTVA